MIDGFFSLTLVMNPGLAFGMLAGVPTAWRWLVALLSIGALAVLATVGLRMLPGGGRGHRASAVTTGAQRSQSVGCAGFSPTRPLQVQQRSHFFQPRACAGTTSSTRPGMSWLS